MTSDGDSRFVGGIPSRASENGPQPFSLRLRVGIALAGITALALLSMLASILIADTARDDAAAINQAGSLRMQSYRIVSLVQADASVDRIRAAVEDFENSLRGAALARVLSDNDDHAATAYREVSHRWRNELRPLLNTDGGSVDRQNGFVSRVDGFVAELDALVHHLQRQAETRIQLLRLVQGIAIFLTLVLVFAAMYLLHSGIMGPLRDLMRVADRARRGDLSARASHTAKDELGLLGASFNAMAGDLQHLYADLERQVESKTEELRRSNQSLSLLYDATRTLTPLDLDTPALSDLADRLRATIHARAVTLCLAVPGSTGAYHSVRADDGDSPPCSATRECSACLVAAGSGTAMHQGVATVPLVSGNERHGVLLIHYPPGDVPAPWKLRLADALAERIGSACSLARESRRQRRLALMEERAIIARELHDSLAQSLSYLKIQAARLQALHRGDQTPSEAGPVLAELREGLNTAYRHLRELLTTFRLKINEPGLEPALRSTVEEFRERDRSLKIELDLNLPDTPLDADAEIHLLQITREALANVLHHARAERATVSIGPCGNGWLRLVVEDDGAGLAANHEQRQHFGLHIMQERSETLGGALSVSPGREGGTRLEVRFPARPAHLTETAEATP